MENAAYGWTRMLVRFAVRTLDYFRKGKRAWLIVQMTLSFLFLFFLSRRFDWRGLLPLIESVPISLYLALLLLAFACQLLYALKWYCVLRSMGYAPGYFNLVRITFIGFFFANFAPSTFGQDFIRVYYLGKESGYLEIGLSVFLDRFFGLLSAISIALALCWSISADLPLLPALRSTLMVLLALFVAGLAAARLPVETVLCSIRGRFRKRACGLERIENWIRCSRTAGSRIRLIPACMALIAAIFLIMSTIYGRLFAAMGGVHLPFLQTMMAVMVVTIFSSIPLAVNGIGLREQLHYLLLSSMGLSKELSVGVSLMVFSFLLVFSLFGLLLWLFSKGGFRRLVG